MLAVVINVLGSLWAINTRQTHEKVKFVFSAPPILCALLLLYHLLALKQQKILYFCFWISGVQIGVSINLWHTLITDTWVIYFHLDTGIIFNNVKAFMKGGSREIFKVATRLTLNLEEASINKEIQVACRK